MAQMTCELCGSTDFIKQDGVFVCQKCGCKYSVEDARKIMAAEQRAEAVAAHGAGRPFGMGAAQPAQPAREGVGKIIDAAKRQVVQAAAGVAGIPLRMETLADFQPGGVNPALAGARAVNNYACQAWQLLLKEYAKLEHPGKAQIEALAGRALECLQLLDNAAMLEPDNHPQAALIYRNCVEIVRSARDCDYYDKRDDGSYTKWGGMPGSIKLTLPGQGQSWEEKERVHRAPLEAEYVAAHPEDAQYRDALQGQRAQLEAELADLKAEKKEHGFFDFSGKREVKDRMKPIQEKIGEVDTQLHALDKKASDHANARIAEIAAGFVQLDF